MKAKAIISIAGLLACLNTTAWTVELTEAQQPSAAAFKAMRYGMFTHIVYRYTNTADGKPYHSFEEFANGIDVTAYSDQLKAFGVEYLIFTGWHAAMYNLGPNAALEKWLPGHTVKRDVIGELADALNERGIKLIIYAHPNDGHDLKPEEQERVGFIKPEKGVARLMPKFNDFINEVYAETASRYAKKPNVLGFWWDSWHGNGGAVDMVRLRKTLLTAMPRAIVLSNNPSREFVDFDSLERYYTKGPFDTIDNLIVENRNQSTIFAGNWWCGGLQEKSLYSPETLFKFTVFNACSGAPGGMAWAISPVSDGKTWASDNLNLMTKLGSLVQAVRPALCGVSASRNWPVKSHTPFMESQGYGATRSLDGSREYIHVLKAPREGKKLTINPAFERFKSAHLLGNGHPVKLDSRADAFVLTLDSADSWDMLDTVIVLERDTTLTHRGFAPEDSALVYSNNWRTMGSKRYTNSGEATVDFSFSGTNLAWSGVTGPDHGIAQVRIDGDAAKTVDCYALTRTEPAVCFTAELPLGKHTVRISSTGKANPAAKGNCVEITGISVLESAPNAK